MAVELFLFRHGRTTWNAQGRYQGHADVDLDALGQAQALAVAARCKEINPIDVYSSDLRRCSDVGKRISEVLDKELMLDKRLRERDVGRWSGMTRDEIKEQFGEEFRLWQEGDESVRPGGGECKGDVTDRIAAFFADMNSKYESGPVVVVTHSGFIRSVVQWVLGQALPRKSFGVPGYGSLTVVRMASDAWSLESFNDRGHLLGIELVDQEKPAPHIY